MEISWWEAAGFATGAVCVWLLVKENVWNWPIGLANNIFYFVIFFRASLYADMLLQLIFFTLGCYGWWNWMFGGDQKDTLPITRLTHREWAWLAVAVAGATVLGAPVLRIAHDAAPWADALTTSLSLAAQYSMTQKRLEHWWLWTAVNLLYIPLYLSRQLPLTALLYAGYVVLCVQGHRQWMRALLLRARHTG